MSRHVEHRTKVCDWCDGRGECLESMSYYDRDWVTCRRCSGVGRLTVEIKIVDGPQPFPLAVDAEIERLRAERAKL